MNRQRSNTLRQGCFSVRSRYTSASQYIIDANERQQFAEGTSRWLLYICGAITIVNTAGLDATKGNEDIAAVAGWVYYHEVLARFSRWYWHDCNGLMKRFVKDLSIEPGTPVPDRKDIRVSSLLQWCTID